MSSYLAKMSAPVLAAGAVALALTGAPQGAQAQSPCGASVTVSPGDTLYRIASRCGTSVGALVRANPQIGDPNTIHVGERIRMPGADTAQAPREQRRALAADHRYRVQRGDTLYRVSRQFGIPLQVILSLNPDLDPRRMPPGFVIRLPGDDGRGDRPRDGDGRMTVTGIVTGEGVECPAIRGQDGQLYTLVGNVDDLQPGDRVQVQGQTAEASFCMQGTTLEVRRMRHVG